VLNKIKGEEMKDFNIKASIVILYIVWILGIIIAKGSMSTTLAILTCGIWSAYLLIISLMM